MQKNHSKGFRLLLLITLLIVVLGSYQYCLAEDSKINDAPTTVLLKESIDFSNGASGFTLNKFWDIKEGELQFNPNQNSKSGFYLNNFTKCLVSDYIISVDSRWIDGPDYGDYGLLFKYSYYDSYYIFVISLNRYVRLVKYDQGKWYSIKSFKCHESSLYDSLKVICQGRLIQCFLNEKKLFEIKDKASSLEYVGVCSSGSIQSGFKNFYVEELPTSK
jgi:hypothetical protein